MKVGTDGVLLGSWAQIKPNGHLLDIGTGTGLIALMLAQRCNAVIDAIDIEKSAFEQATFNAAKSPWGKRISVFHSSLQDFKPNKKYDLIVSNPPYFKNSIEAKTNERSLARHSKALSLHEIIDFTFNHLSTEGKLSIILPTENFEELVVIAKNNKLSLCRKTKVLPTPQSIPKRMLAEFCFTPTECVSDSLIIEDKGRHGYSGEYIALTNEFYLKM